MKTFRYLEGVATITFDQDLCIGCGMCQEVCPHQVFKVEGRKAAVVDRDACMECGACKTNCPVEAIQVTPGVGCASYIIKKWLKGKDAYVECC